MVLEGGPALSCSKGCSDCCLHPVTTSVFEGLLIYRHLVASGRWTPSLRHSLEKASDALLGLAYEVWLLSAQPCVFLEGSLCSVYPVRPIQCRTTFSIEDPSLCHPHRLTGSALLPRSDLLEEYGTKERKLMRDVGVARFQIPIPTAVLLGERLETGKVDIEQLDAEIIRLYKETT